MSRPSDQEGSSAPAGPQKGCPGRTVSAGVCSRGSSPTRPRGQSAGTGCSSAPESRRHFKSQRPLSYTPSLSTLNEYKIFIFKVKHGICDTTIILWLWYSGITPRYNFGVKRHSLYREVCNINIISWRGPDHSHTMFHGMYRGAGYMGSV